MPTSTPLGRAWAATACLAIVAPALLAFNLPPSATFLNQAAALVGWGIFLFLTASALPRGALQGTVPAAPLLAALGLLLIASLASPPWTGLPWSLALSSAGAIAAGMLAVAAGASLQNDGVRPCLLIPQYILWGMARHLRIESPGAVYHVTARGDRREPIFADDDDRGALLAVAALAPSGTMGTGTMAGTMGSGLAFCHPKTAHERDRGQNGVRQNKTGAGLASCPLPLRREA